MATQNTPSSAAVSFGQGPLTESAAEVSRGRSSAVRCRQVTKTYGSGNSAVRALRGIDLDVYTGELLMLVGPSGCGKTTLISVIAGVLERDGGDCTVLGEDFDKLSSSARPDSAARTSALSSSPSTSSPRSRSRRTPRCRF